MHTLMSETELGALKRWLLVVLAAALVGAGDYLLAAGGADWRESAAKALGAGVLAAWPVIRSALLATPPDAPTPHG